MTNTKKYILVSSWPGIETYDDIPSLLERVKYLVSLLEITPSEIQSRFRIFEVTREMDLKVGVNIDIK
jgi:hypothetical protein